MDSFRAAVLRQQNEPLAVLNLNHTKPKIGQVKIRMITSSLCGAQVNEISGKKGPDKFLPHCMGHEGFGEVVAIGPSVTNIKVGDSVILHWKPGNGCDVLGGSYKSSCGLTVGSGPVTTFSEYTIISENRCTPVTNVQSMESILPLVGCALSTSFGAVKKEANVSSNDEVIIIGAGGLGQCLAFWCNIFGAKSVTVVDVHPEKAAIVKKLGAKFATLDEVKNCGGYSKVFETTGVIQNISQTLQLASKEANILLIGQPMTGTSITFDNFLKFFDGISIAPSMGGHFNPAVDTENILGFCRTHHEVLKQLVSHRITLNDINKGFDMMKQPDAGRVVVDFA